MTLALFDLDNTLLDGDSDYEWGRFLVNKGLVDPLIYNQQNEYFYEQYAQGTLDIHAYSSFAFKPLAERTMDELNVLHEEYMRDYIQPIMTDKSKQLIKQHQAAGDTVVIITATNSFIAKPIADAFGVEHFMATDPLIVDGRYVAKIDGTPCFREGKITKLKEWLANRQDTQGFTGSYFYSDSINDLPMLELVDKPIVVNADEKLMAIAKERGWKSISLRR